MVMPEKQFHVLGGMGSQNILHTCRGNFRTKYRRQPHTEWIKKLQQKVSMWKLRTPVGRPSWMNKRNLSWKEKNRSTFHFGYKSWKNLERRVPIDGLFWMKLWKEFRYGRGPVDRPFWIKERKTSWFSRYYPLLLLPFGTSLNRWYTSQRKYLSLNSYYISLQLSSM